MAKKYGQESKLTGFTRGGAPVGRRTGATSKTKVNPTKGRNWGPGEWAALGIAGAATGLVGAATVGALREGFGTGVLGNKKGR